MKSIFITGANGFIGSNLCQYFSEKGFKVYGLVRSTSDLHFLKGIKTNLIYGDLKKSENIDIPQEIHYVIHSASIVSDNASKEQCQLDIYEISVNLFKRIRELKLKLKKFIYISTALTLGFDGIGISEQKPGESALFLPYVFFKKKTEDFFLKQYKENNFPVVILRPSDVYGPHDRTSCLLMLRGIERGIPIIIGHGNWYFGYCYIKNLCQATYLVSLKADIEGETYTVTNSKLPTWREFFSGLQKALKKKQYLYIPVWFGYAVATVYQFIHILFPGFVPPVNRYRIKRITSHSTYDISKILKVLDYKPDNRTDYQIKEIVSWYLREKEWEKEQRGQKKKT